MVGLSWAQLGIIVLVGAFVLGPERIPTAVTFVTGSLRKVRSMAAGAQAGLRSEIGPELDELRRQVADLQSLKEIQELRDLRNLHPKNFISKSLLGPELSGGVTGFLGLGDADRADDGRSGPDRSPSETTDSPGADRVGTGRVGADRSSATEALMAQAAAVRLPPTPSAPDATSAADASAIEPVTVPIPDSARSGVLLTKPVRTMVPDERPRFDSDGT